MSTMVSIMDIARQLGVSPSTVSRAINGKRYVKPEKRQHILRLVDEMGYVPNKAARNMVLKRTFTVGIIIPDTFNMFQRQLFSIIERHLEAFGYNTMFFFVKTDDASDRECLTRIKAEQLDGIIMLHEIKDHRLYEYISTAGFPAVTVTFDSQVKSLPAIHVDEKAAARSAVGHLLALGHRRIKMISGAVFSFGQQRVEGYHLAMEEAHIPRELQQVALVQTYTAEAGMAGMHNLLSCGRDFTAVFAATDELAIGAIRALTDERIPVPAGISVIGFDDIDISAYFTPRLTTIRQPLARIGEQAATQLHDRISNFAMIHGETVMPYELVIRESTAPV
jgi:LacI family transcriptional regulator